MTIEMRRRADLEEIARGNIEAHLEDGDDLYEEAYVLGFDALADAGVAHDLAREIAREVAMGYAQP